MSLKFGLSLPQGWTMDLVGIKDPVEAYETMTRVAQAADAQVSLLSGSTIISIRLLVHLRK